MKSMSPIKLPAPKRSSTIAMQQPSIINIIRSNASSAEEDVKNGISLVHSKKSFGDRQIITIHQNKPSKIVSSPLKYINGQRCSSASIKELNRLKNQPEIKENFIRLNHFKNEKNAKQVPSSNGQLSSKVLNSIDAPTLIVSNHVGKQISTFLPTHIHTKGKVEKSKGSVFTPPATFSSVLITTQRPNISLSESNLASTKGNTNPIPFNKGTTTLAKENQLKLKNSINASGNKHLLNANLPKSGSSMSSKEPYEILQKGNSNSSLKIMQTNYKGSENKSIIQEESKEINTLPDNFLKPMQRTNSAVKENGNKVMTFILHSGTNSTPSADHINGNFQSDIQIHPSESNLKDNECNMASKPGCKEIENVKHNPFEAASNYDSSEGSKSDESQPILCNICDGDVSFTSHTLFMLHYNKHHCLRTCQICQTDCFGSIGHHTHMVNNHSDSHIKEGDTVDNETATDLIDKHINTNGNIKQIVHQNNAPLQRTMKDIRYHQEVIPRNCNPKRYKTLHRCQECKYMTYHGQNLNRHIDSFHHKRSCHFCGIVCTGKKPLTDHLRIVHQAKVSPDKYGGQITSISKLKKYKDPQKKITATLLKRSKKWDTKLGKGHTYVNKKTGRDTQWAKMGKNQINHKLSSKKRLLKNVRNEMRVLKDQRKKESLITMVSLQLEDDDEQIATCKCPYCCIEFSNTVYMAEHVQAEHGVALHFLTRDENLFSGDVARSNEFSAAYDHSSEPFFNNRKLSKNKGSSKKVRYSSESSDNWSTDDYEDDDFKPTHLGVRSFDHGNKMAQLYDHWLMESGYCLEDKEDLVEFEQCDDNIIENLMQQAFSNVMCFSTQEDSNDCYTDVDNVLSAADDTNSVTDFTNNATSCYTKCLPTNENLATWELFREF